MGCYIEPKGQNKFDYLNSVGQEVSLHDFLSFFRYTYKQENYPVIYFNNGSYDYGVILYDEKEYRRVLKELPKDSKIFIVPLNELELVSNVKEFIFW